jgi:hypothetical protein
MTTREMIGDTTTSYALFDELKAAKPEGVYVTPENVIAAAHLLLQEQAECFRDGFGYLRIRAV